MNYFDDVNFPSENDILNWNEHNDHVDDGPHEERLLDCGLCYTENGEEVHPHPKCIIGRYPEHEKRRRISDKSQAIYDFLMWAQDKGFEFGRTAVERVAVFEGTEDVTVLHPAEGRQLKQLLAEHFGIDLKRLEAEQEQMVADMAALTVAAKEER